MQGTDPITIPASQTVVLSSRHRLTLSVQSQAAQLRLLFGSPAGTWAHGNLQFACAASAVTVRSWRQGTRISLKFRDGRCWRMWLRADDSEPVIEVIECASVRALPWQLEFTGTTVFTHQGVALEQSPAREARYRLGAFTQHGQLFNLKDWILVQAGAACSGLLALRPGRWTTPDRNLITVTSGAGGVQCALPLEHAGWLRRSYLLAHGPVATLTGLTRLGIAYFEPEAGFPAWPARQIAAHGFARRERLATFQRQGEQAGAQRPPAFAFGDAHALPQARDRVHNQPALAGQHPFWNGDGPAATKWVLERLQRVHDALTMEGYLHPIGNPVGCRDLAPATATFHFLDWSGQLQDADRRRGAGLISILAQLLARRDFYPHHVATIPSGAPGSVQHIYRGMLNQNFNTDRYTFVGIAGCVLTQHPQARAWRQHAIQQCDQQLQAYVWPGGAWEESHSYANHVKLCLLPLVLALRHAPEPVDLLADKRLAAMCRFPIPLLSPPDPLAGGTRAIPAIGDHGYSNEEGYLLGWLATLCPAERQLYTWAWHEMGAQPTATRSQASTFSPLLAPVPTAGQSDPVPMLPTLKHCPGYGAVARSGLGTPAESVLVVRCGEAWGHYHPDQGSFWWWWRQRLVCTDADLGSGQLKFEHLGHNVLGYPDRCPQQYLDRTPFQVDDCRLTSAGETVIRCQIPVPGWMVRPHHDEPVRRAGGAGTVLRPRQDEPIPLAQQPHLTRTFVWRAPAVLTVDDAPVRSPAGQVTWTLHVVCRAMRQTGPLQIDCALAEAGQPLLVVQLPVEPLAVQIVPGPITWRLTCLYPEQPLRHTLTVCDTQFIVVPKGN